MLPPLVVKQKRVHMTMEVFRRYREGNVSKGDMGVVVEELTT